MATKKATKKPTKTGFVLGVPRDLPAAKVVEKGKAVGITLTAQQIYKIRSQANARKVSKAAKPAAKGKRKAGKLSASDFIRKYPSKSANDIVELGKKQGLRFTISSVYQCRSYDKKRKGGSKKTKGKPGPKRKTPVFQVFSGGGGSEAELKKAALAVGFPRALKVVEDLAKKFEGLQRQYAELMG